MSCQRSLGSRPCCARPCSHLPILALPPSMSTMLPSPTLVHTGLRLGGSATRSQRLSSADYHPTSCTLWVHCSGCPCTQAHDAPTPAWLWTSPACVCLDTPNSRTRSKPRKGYSQQQQERVSLHQARHTSGSWIHTTVLPRFLAGAIQQNCAHPARRGCGQQLQVQ